MAEKALLVVSFGSTHEDTQEKAIAPAEQDLAAAFPDRKCYRAWSSRFICRKMNERGKHVDTPEEALERMAEDGITDVLVQPTFLTPNVEYLQTLEAVRAAKSRFEHIACGTPVVTYRTGGSVESVTPETGAVVEQGDVRGLLEALHAIRMQGKESYTGRCRSYALSHFSKDDCFRKYISLYESLATG